MTPGHIEVLALTNDDEEAVAGFLDRKRQWLFNTVREMERITANRHAVPRFITWIRLFMGQSVGHLIGDVLDQLASEHHMQ